jgi:histidyl-tRNA synthetase
VCFFAPLGNPAAQRSLILARDLRQQGFVAEVDGRGGSLKSLLRRADAIGARCAVVIGDSELANDSAILKDLTRHTQESVTLAALSEAIRKLLSESNTQSPGELI